MLIVLNCAVSVNIRDASHVVMSGIYNILNEIYDSNPSIFCFMKPSYMNEMLVQFCIIVGKTRKLISVFYYIIPDEENLV